MRALRVIVDEKVYVVAQALLGAVHSEDGSVYEVSDGESGGDIGRFRLVHDQEDEEIHLIGDQVNALVVLTVAEEWLGARPRTPE